MAVGAWLLIIKPPSPQSAMTLRSGKIMLDAMAEGRPAPMVASALPTRKGLGLCAG